MGILASEDLSNVTLEKKTSPATTYSALNAYGATMEVRKYSEEEFGVIWCATNDGSCPASIPSRAFEVKMSADEAKAAKEGARFLVIGKLTDAISKWSYVIEFVNRSKPEMGKPLDVTTTARVLEFEASEIWVYDGPTGKLYLRVKLPKML